MLLGVRVQSKGLALLLCLKNWLKLQRHLHID